MCEIECLQEHALVQHMHFCTMNMYDYVHNELISTCLIMVAFVIAKNMHELNQSKRD